MKQIPNVLSALRIILVGVFICLFMDKQYLFCLIVYLAAFATDILDGYLARRNNWITNIGKVLDPLADKLMLISVLACFYMVGEIPLYILLIALLKEVVMIIAGVFLYMKHVVVYSDWYGKIATGLFALAIVLSFTHIIWNFFPFDMHLYVYLIAICAGIVSFFHYGIKTFIKKQGNGRISEE